MRGCDGQEEHWFVEIVRILIAPDFRHKGPGTAMIREIRYLGEKAAC